VKRGGVRSAEALRAERWEEPGAACSNPDMVGEFEQAGFID
jgi:hypothetical protein